MRSPSPLPAGPRERYGRDQSVVPWPSDGRRSDRSRDGPPLLLISPPVRALITPTSRHVTQSRHVTAASRSHGAVTSRSGQTITARAGGGGGGVRASAADSPPPPPPAQAVSLLGFSDTPSQEKQGSTCPDRGPVRPPRGPSPDRGPNCPNCPHSCPNSQRGPLILIGAIRARPGVAHC